MTPPEVSILIVSYNTRELLRGCLRSLRRVADEARAEIIVVDNASLDGSAEAVAAEFGEVQVIRSGVNVGFASAMNRGINVATGKYLFMLNPDTIVVPGAIRVLVQSLERHPRVAMAGAGLTFADGSTQASTFGFPTLFKEFLNFVPELKAILRPRQTADFINRLIRRNVHKLGQIRAPFPAKVVSGAAFLARTDVIRQVGGFDGKFFLYHEELDLCRRLQDARWEVWSVPAAQVIHFDAQATGYRACRLPHSPILEWRIGGMDRYWAKHAGPAAQRRWRCLARGLLRLRTWGNTLPFGPVAERRERRAELRRVVQMLTPHGDSAMPIAAA